MEQWNYKVPGIPDDYFIRAEVPMTKEEVRALVISKLRLKEDYIVYDIGAGSGSVSVEMALLLSRGKVYALEKKKEALQLIKKNRAKFKLENIELIEAVAPDKMAELAAADRIFIGGSGGNLKEIIKAADNKLKNRGRIVLTAVTLNTLTESIEELEKLNYSLNIVNISVSRTKNVKEYKMFRALNPVYIISAEKQQCD